MSNIAMFNPSNVPAFAKNAELSATTLALAGGVNTSGGMKRVSIKGGVFRLLSGGKEVASIEDRHLDVIVVKAAPKVSRIFYAGSYDKDAAAAAPDCTSADGDKPDAGVRNKQAASCAACPQNIAGSGNGQSRACRYQQRLAVVLANDVEGDVMQLALPATSIFGKEDGENRPLQAYARWLVAQSVDPSMVVTRMKFDTKAEAPKLHFKAMRWLTDDEYELATKQGATDDASKAVVLNVATQDGKPADALKGIAPKKTVAQLADDEADEAPAPKAKAKPKAVEVEEDEEPTVRKEEKKPSAVPGKKSLADVVGAWDDED